MIYSPVVTDVARFVSNLHLVTASDIIPVLVPQTFFAIFSATSTRFYLDHSISSPDLLATRLPHVIVWIWLQLLVLDLANQRLPESVAEDRINKPWRPIPSKRMTTKEARSLLLLSIIATFAASIHFGAATEAMFLFTLNWMYNDLDLANSNWWARNGLNGLGITTMGAGATRILCGPSARLDQAALHCWWALCAAMIGTTIHGQDLYDQEGDAVRGRRTAPIVLGDAAARWSLIASILVWSALMPACLGLAFHTVYAFSIFVGLLIGSRLLLLRDTASDKLTFKIWVAWTMGLYALPLF